MYVSFIFHTQIYINCKKYIYIIVTILIFSRFTSIYVPINYEKDTFPGFDFVTLLVVEGNPVDTGRKLNVRKTFRRRPGRYVRSIYVLCLRGNNMFSE